MIPALIMSATAGAKIPVRGDITALDVLSKVDQFYNTSWNHLSTTLNTGLTIIALAVTIFGILLPLFLQYQARKKYDLEFENLKRETQKRINGEVSQLRTQIVRMEDNITALGASIQGAKDNIDSSYLRAIGGVYFVQGDLMMQNGNLLEGLRSYLDSLNCATKLENVEMFDLCWNRAKELIDNAAVAIAIGGAPEQRKRIISVLAKISQSMKGKDKFNQQALELNRFAAHISRSV